MGINGKSYNSRPGRPGIVTGKAVVLHLPLAVFEIKEYNTFG
jgi:hypothetical protein